MKQFFLLFVVLLMVCSCSDEILNEDNHQAILGASNATFSFDSITEPSNWRKYQSLEEMLAACQIPEGKLKSMSTDELIEVCMNHPLRGIFSAYSNELDGVSVIVHNFNGFIELKNRKDAASKLLLFYEKVNCVPHDGTIPNKSYADISHFGFIDLYIASKDLKDLYAGQHLSELERISKNVFDLRLNKNEKSLSSIRHSLLIIAQVKLEEKSIDAEDSETLRRFVKVSGQVQDPKEYTKVSLILSK